NVLEKRVKDCHPAQGGGYRTAALFRAAVFVTEDQKAKKRGKKGKTKARGGLSGACG
ncbi:hypothetical protein KI387_006351, partial [Taxus chinensis]